MFRIFYDTKLKRRLEGDHGIQNDKELVNCLFVDDTASLCFFSYIKFIDQYPSISAEALREIIPPGTYIEKQ